MIQMSLMTIISADLQATWDQTKTTINNQENLHPQKPKANTLQPLLVICSKPCHANASYSFIFPREITFRHPDHESLESLQVSERKHE